MRSAESFDCQSDNIGGDGNDSRGIIACGIDSSFDWPLVKFPNPMKGNYE
jgi:hypothetical protein